jgi:uncharacterized membrane protein YfcA
VLTLLLLALVSIGAGFLGSLLGLGGGFILVPALVLLFNINIHLAIAASLVSVVATSIGSASTSVASGTTDLRIGMFLESTTAVGGLAGALVAVTVLAANDEVLVLLFVPAVIFGAYLMLRQRTTDTRPDVRRDPRAERFGLGGAYTDPRTGQRVAYQVTRTGTGLVFSGLAGVAGGLLGIGGGIFYVPAMNAVMNVPLRVASATSMFMIGLTAAGAAFVYLYAGDVTLLLAAPVVLGVLAGSFVGVRLQPRASTPSLKLLFAIVVVIAAILMALRGFGVY